MASPFLNLALDGGDWSASRPGRFNPEERAPGTHWIGGWVDYKASLDAMEKRKSYPCRESKAGRPAHTPSLYRLRYSDSHKYIGYTAI
jgi:hypothetical protein